MEQASCHQRQSLLGIRGHYAVYRAKLGTHMVSLALNGLAFLIETASVAGTFMSFTPFTVYLLLYWPWPPLQSVCNLALQSNKQERERKGVLMSKIMLFRMLVIQLS